MRPRGPATRPGPGKAGVRRRIGEDRSDFVFTPERLADPEFLATLGGAADFVVIDEAYCISQWGHDLRPSYLALREAVRALGDPPLLALTATATDEVVGDIGRQFGRPNLRILRAGIYRPNLRLAVEHVSGDDEKRGEPVRLLEAGEGTGIVYAATLRHAEDVIRFLQGEGFMAELAGKPVG